jgi:hypothetical protein
VEIEVWSVGKAKFTADPEFQEPMIREVIDQRGDVADVIIDYTDSERSDISYDEYARVTGDVPGLVLFEGWLTGDRNAPPPGGALTAGEQAATVAARHAAEAGLPPEVAAIVAQAVPTLAAAEADRARLAELVRRYERITTSWTRGMYSARIDCVRGDVKAAIQCLSEGLDGYDGTEWDGTETGAEWWERTKAVEGL